MYALQRRGRRSRPALVATLDGKLRRHVEMSLVSEAFDEKTLAKLPGRTAIGHVRYSTAGSSELRNAQPFVFEYAGGAVSIAHNGNLVNANELRAELEAQGSIFQTSSDTEVIVHPGGEGQAAGHPRLDDRRCARSACVAPSSLILLTHDEKMIGVRDPNGFRPLVIGRLKEALVLSSETCSVRSRRGRADPQDRPGVGRDGSRKGGMTSQMAAVDPVSARSLRVRAACTSRGPIAS